VVRWTFRTSTPLTRDFFFVHQPTFVRPTRGSQQTNSRPILSLPVGSAYRSRQGLGQAPQPEHAALHLCSSPFPPHHPTRLGRIGRYWSHELMPLPKCNSEDGCTRAQPEGGAGGVARGCGVQRPPFSPACQHEARAGEPPSPKHHLTITGLLSKPAASGVLH
jgi:hypothetical protein